MCVRYTLHRASVTSTSMHFVSQKHNCFLPQIAQHKTPSAVDVCYLFISPRPEAGAQHLTQDHLLSSLGPWVLVPSTGTGPGPGTGPGMHIKSTQCPQVCCNGSGHVLARAQLPFRSCSDPCHYFLLSIS